MHKISLLEFGHLLRFLAFTSVLHTAIYVYVFSINHLHLFPLVTPESTEQFLRSSLHLVRRDDSGGGEQGRML